jgi:hypothetical protein
MQQMPDPRILRETARFLQETASDVFSLYSDLTFPLVTGDLRRFPQQSPEDQAAEQGIGVLREDIARVTAQLYALAAALDNRLPVPPIVLISVQPYIEAYLASRPANQDQEDQPA